MRGEMRAHPAPIVLPPSPGQIAYEQDCKARPTYMGDKPRCTWEQLDPVAQASWERNPTPRDWSQWQAWKAAQPANA